MFIYQFNDQEADKFTLNITISLTILLIILRDRVSKSIRSINNLWKKLVIFVLFHIWQSILKELN